MSHSPENRALVIGGTGMLAGCVDALLRHGWHVSVVARQHPDAVRYQPITADYDQGQSFLRTLRLESEMGGGYDLIAAWMHGDPTRLVSVVETLRLAGRAQHVLHVLGSSSADPSANPSACEQRRLRLEALGVRYTEVVLGFVIENTSADGRSRWLTNDEISRGVFTALKTAAPRTVVGVLKPWAKRP